MEEKEERRLCLTPCSVFKMVAFVCSESIIPAIPNGKRRQDSLLHSLQPSDVLRCIWRRKQLHQYPVLFCVISDPGRHALARAVAESVPVDNKLIVGTLCWLT